MSGETIEQSDSEKLVKNPLVSVVMITYNHEQYLGQAIEGVVAQKTNFPLELIIGEDCSTDGTRRIALEYQRRYPEIIRVLFSENNVGANRNYVRTLFAARGEYVASCEGDDYWTDVSKLQKQIDFLKGNGEFVAAYHDSIMVDQTGEITQESALGAWKKDYSARELQATRLMPTQTLCFRNVIRELPPEFYSVLAADAFIISMLGAYGGGKYMPDIKPSAYRQHAGGIWSQTGQDKQSKEMIVTNYWLAVYYKRLGFHALSIGFARKILEHVLKRFNVGIGPLLLSLMHVYLHGPYRLLRDLRDRAWRK